MLSSNISSSIWQDMNNLFCNGQPEFEKTFLLYFSNECPHGLLIHTFLSKIQRLADIVITGACKIFWRREIPPHPPKRPLKYRKIAKFTGKLEIRISLEPKIPLPPLLEIQKSLNSTRYWTGWFGCYKENTRQLCLAIRHRWS